MPYPVPRRLDWRGIDIAGEQLMYAAGIKIRRRGAYAFIHLMLDPHSGFYLGWRIQAGLRPIVGRQRNRFLCGAVRWGSTGVGLNALHLPPLVKVVAVYIEQQVIGVSIEENSIARAQHGLWRLAAGSKAIRKGDAWTKIEFVWNVVLRLEAQPIAEGEVGPHLPVVLSIKTQIDYAHTLVRSPSRDGKLARLIYLVVNEIGISIG